MPRLAGVGVLSLLAACSGQPSPTPEADWRVPGGEPGNSRYSPLTQIDTTNVAQLRVA